MKSYCIAILVIAQSSLFLSILHIYNGFPMLMTDSIGYLQRAATLTETNHWSNTYTIFLAGVIFLFKSVQFVPIIQNLLVASLLYIFCKHYLPKFNHFKFLVIILALLSTTLVWISSLIMSDIFTPLSILCIVLFLEKSLSTKETILIFSVLFFGFSTHQSHLLIMPLFVFTVATLMVIFQKVNTKSLLIKLSILVIIFICSQLIEQNALNNNSHINNSDKTQNTVSKSNISSGYYFVAVRIAQSGNLEPLLKDFCTDKKANYLCSEKNNFDVSRIRTTPQVARMGSNKNYVKYAKDNKEFVMFSLLKSKTYIGIIKLGLNKGFNLLKKTKIKRIQKFNKIQRSRITTSLDLINKEDANSFVVSSQICLNFNYISKQIFYRWTNLWWVILGPISLLLFVLLICFRKATSLKIDKLMFIVYLLFGHFLNVMVCGTFSNYRNVRYSSRTLWLVNLCMLIILFYTFEYLKNRTALKKHEANRTNTLS